MLNVKEYAAALFDKHGDDASAVQCDGCGKEALLFDLDAVADLIEHALFDHVGRCGIVAIRYRSVVEGWQLAFDLGLDAQTDAEQRWRDEGRPPENL